MRSTWSLSWYHHICRAAAAAVCNMRRPISPGKERNGSCNLTVTPSAADFMFIAAVWRFYILHVRAPRVYDLKFLSLATLCGDIKKDTGEEKKDVGQRGHIKILAMTNMTRFCLWLWILGLFCCQFTYLLFIAAIKLRRCNIYCLQVAQVLKLQQPFLSCSKDTCRS